ncbi:MAG TPA: SDR family oxidoreductase [Geminicoccus sp.]|uniref:SDR family oxidoreductase n=1 Tax=Geminicoccus sp. TaxID=2024832 RepID=UPI002E372884|nr:SDR family oxidoreductase [Geminicoccus sp.]HEX2528333.1 SDR family oxidoreductase [Geminicoccus sp.]
MHDPLFDLTGRVVVVTGALGQLGSAYAEALVQRGAKVALLDRHDDVSKLSDELKLACADGRALAVAADVTDRDALVAALERIEAQLGTPFGLIANAALDSPPSAPASENGPFEDYPVDSFRKVLDVNVTGVMLCCQVFGGAMARSGRGSIVLIGSIYGVVSPDQSIYEYRRSETETFFKPVAYSASKSALYNLTRYLATYWAPRQVRVNSVTLAGVFANQDPRFLEGYLKKMPLGRMAEPDDYTGIMVYLLSDASRYATGAEFRIDGGWTAW